MADYRKRIAEAIAFARESVGVSQRELADRLKRDKRTLQKWEKGEMKLSLEDFFEIFEALRVPVEPYSKWIRHPVIDNYNEAVEAGTLTEPNAPQPNMEILIACYEASVESIREGRNQYALGDLQDRRASQKETDAEKSEKSK